MTPPHILRSLLLLLALASPLAVAACYEDAAAKNQLPVAMLQAIAKVESNFDPAAVNLNRNGTADIGIMQINSSWLPRLAKYGITRDALLDACTNLHVGAWVLASNVRRHGWNWTAIGAYNAKSPAHRQRYAARVWTALQQLDGSTGKASLFKGQPKLASVPSPDR